MICYKDMTFCKYYKECGIGHDCHRALTEEVREGADKWWGKGKDAAPICIFSEKPNCFEEPRLEE